MTMVEAAVAVLKALKRPATIREIYEEIEKRKLFTFGAKEPVGVLGSAIRRHTAGNRALKGDPAFKLAGKGTYGLL